MTAAGDRQPIWLGEQSAGLLVLVAGFHGLTPQEWIERAIAKEAERIGLPAMAREGAPIEASIAGTRLQLGGGAGEPGAGMARGTRDHACAISRLEGKPGGENQS